MNKKTALYDLHVSHKAKMVPFAGYEMPIEYSTGVMHEHKWVRSNSGLFDVSHMGQIIIEGEDASGFLSVITPSVFSKTPLGNAKYTVLTNDDGGIIDDLIITKLSENKFFAVINAACKEKDIKWIESKMPGGLSLNVLDNRSLIAVQGPKSLNVLSNIIENYDVQTHAYMSLKSAFYNGNKIYVSRLGYTGEDGFEISVVHEDAKKLWEDLLMDDYVKEIGLGARDTLRLEMGYPLYGNDIDTQTSPIEADLQWIVARSNKDFVGSDRVLREKENGVSRKRVGVVINDKGIARDGAEILSLEDEKIGKITSGGFSPTLEKSIGQGYVNTKFSETGTQVLVKVRKRNLHAQITSLPFITPKTKPSIKK